jgi:hypothetical protein
MRLAETDHLPIYTAELLSVQVSSIQNLARDTEFYPRGNGHPVRRGASAEHHVFAYRQTLELRVEHRQRQRSL